MGCRLDRARCLGPVTLFDASSRYIESVLASHHIHMREYRSATPSDDETDEKNESQVFGQLAQAFPK